MSRKLALTLTALAVVGATAPATAAPPHPAASGRQAAYRAAAAEHGVPEKVLLAVSYLESRWDTNGGQPSTAAGYGPMHLTDLETANAGALGLHHNEGTEDPRGDSARPALAPEPAEVGGVVASLHTVDLAARLTGIDKAKLRSDATANIRGGAALLAHYQQQLGGKRTTDPSAWYGAVARYSGATERGAAAAFADEVFSVLSSGAARTTDDGQPVSVAASPVNPDRSALDRMNLTTAAAAAVECPTGISCGSVPAPYQQIDGGYGNHDLSNRPVNQKVDYIVIHDTEATWATTLQLVQDPTYVSWHYSLRSSDGYIAQHVPTKDVAWHAGNWYVNAKAIGLEHEGFAAQGTWFTEAMYRTSAKLVRYLANKYRIPVDRQHILGHDNVPGTVPSTVAGMHWDPGPYFDWSHYFDLLGAPFRGDAGAPNVVTVKPDFATNKPAFTNCDGKGNPCAPRSSSSVVLRTQPSDTAPLLKDAGINPNGPSTMRVSDVGSRVDAGQHFVVSRRSGDWTAIWYLGQEGWFRSANAIPGRGAVATPKAGVQSIPVYGRAYPEASAYPAGVDVQAVTPLQYTLPAGQS
ncbi:N-acetylmuramoyl-L-alanine amidase, partial [Actinokineospora bangkokensis]